MNDIGYITNLLVEIDNLKLDNLRYKRIIKILFDFIKCLQLEVDFDTFLTSRYDDEYIEIIKEVYKL